MYMTYEETTKILAILTAMYPKDFEHINETNQDVVTKIWLRQLSNRSYKEVSHAVEAYIATDVYGKAPTVGKIKQMLQTVSKANITPQEAWNILYHAICHGGYDMHRVHEKLPYEIKICVTPEQMHEWAFETDAKTCQTVIASNFQRSYQAKQQYINQMERIPKRSIQAIRSENIKTLGNDKKQKEIEMLSGLLEVLDKAK